MLEEGERLGDRVKEGESVATLLLLTVAVPEERLLPVAPPHGVAVGVELPLRLREEEGVMDSEGVTVGEMEAPLEGEPAPKTPPAIAEEEVVLDAVPGAEAEEGKVPLTLAVKVVVTVALRVDRALGVVVWEVVTVRVPLWQVEADWELVGEAPPKGLPVAPALPEAAAEAVAFQLALAAGELDTLAHWETLPLKVALRVAVVQREGEGVFEGDTVGHWEGDTEGVLLTLGLGVAEGHTLPEPTPGVMLRLTVALTLALAVAVPALAEMVE